MVLVLVGFARELADQMVRECGVDPHAVQFAGTAAQASLILQGIRRPAVVAISAGLTGADRHALMGDIGEPCPGLVVLTQDPSEDADAVIARLGSLVGNPKRNRMSAPVTEGADSPDPCRPPLNSTPLDLNAVISASADLLRRTLPRGIEVSTKLDDSGCHVVADRKVMEDALLDLAINACDTLPGAGVIALETHKINLHIGDPVLRESGLAPGSYCQVVMRDTATGIDRKNIGSVTDPYFTTKGAEKGRSPGLSVVRGFARKSGGAARVVSGSGQGTAVHLYFECVGCPRPANAGDLPSGDARDDRTRVLVVEDDDHVRNMLMNQLRRTNVRPTAVATGDEAVKVFSRRGLFDVVLLDMVMPGQAQGADVARHIRGLDADVGIILLSGYAGSLDQPDIGHVNAMLTKPVAKADLLAQIDQVTPSGVVSAAH